MGGAERCDCLGNNKLWLEVPSVQLNAAVILGPGDLRVKEAILDGEVVSLDPEGRQDSRGLPTLFLVSFRNRLTLVSDMTHRLCPGGRPNVSSRVRRAEP